MLSKSFYMISNSYKAKLFLKSLIMPLLSPYISPIPQSLIQHPQIFQTGQRPGF